MDKVYFKTHGCSTNFSETEIMKGLLKEVKFEIVDKPDQAQVIIINVCTVKGDINALRSIRETIENTPGRRYVVAGCLTSDLIKGIREITEDAGLINTSNIASIVEVVEEAINDNAIEVLSEGRKDVKLCMPKVRNNPVVGIVPILSGCNNSCSYCSVKLVKGRLFSYPKDKIIEEVKKCLNDGCKEIWITSQDNAAYGMDKEAAALPELLGDILQINKEFMLRLGMMNPNNVRVIIDDLIKIYKENKKIFKFLHIPVQSGNDEVLESMNRNYKAEDFKDIVDKFKKEIPKLTLSTDIICGFPGETDEQFSDSLSLVKELRPDVLNISRFQSRPGTEAAKMEQINGRITKERSRILTDIFLNTANIVNEQWLDWTGTVIIDEKGKDNTMVGRNFAYKPIIVEGSFKLGEILKVKVEKSTPHDLRAIKIS